MTVVAADSIAKAYGRGTARVVALHGVDLSVSDGEVVALVGPSGSGKTTLLNIVAGWEEPDAGVVRWRDPARAWTDLAVVPQQPGLLDELTLRENVELPLRLGAPVRQEPDALLGLLGVGHLADRLPPELSHGEQQRASIARALVVAPRLLVADEPTAHLDEVTSGVVLDVLRAAAGTGTACLIASHDPRVVERADRVVALRDGRLA